MKAFLFSLAALLFPISVFGAKDVLIVADEFPAMEYVAAKLKSDEGVSAHVIWQTNLPPDLSAYSTVLVYIHRNLNEAAERAFIHYTENGGKLVVLHHSISSGKRKNQDWFKFLGVTLPEAEVSVGGYKWIEGITQQIANLAPDHFITSHKVSYPEQIPFQAKGDAALKTFAGVSLHESEVYLNHVLAEDPKRTVLLGLKYQDKDSGKTYMQAHSGWFKPSGKGWIIYLQPGHSLHDLQNPTFERILLNAIIWSP